MLSHRTRYTFGGVLLFFCACLFALAAASSQGIGMYGLAPRVATLLNVALVLVVGCIGFNFAARSCRRDFANGSLQRVSFARPGKLFTAHEGLLQRRVGILTLASHARVVECVIALLRHDVVA